MNADTLLLAALDAGLDLRLDGDALKLSGDTDAVHAWAPRLRPFKAELIQRLTESSRVTHALLRAAMRACDCHGDDQPAREQMRADVLAVPHDQRADLLDHFRRSYPALPQSDGGTAPLPAEDSQGTPTGNAGRVNSTSNGF